MIHIALKHWRTTLCLLIAGLIITGMIYANYAGRKSATQNILNDTSERLKDAKEFMDARRNEPVVDRMCDYASRRGLPWCAGS